MKSVSPSPQYLHIPIPPKCRMIETYMSSLHQSLRLDSIIMESTPLLKRIPSNGMFRLGIPRQHLRSVRQTSTVTESLDGLRRLVEHIIRIDDTHLDASRRLSIRRGVQLRARCNPRPDQSCLAQIIKVPTQLVVPGLQWVVVVEPGHLVQRWDRASQVRRNAVVRVAD